MSIVRDVGNEGRDWRFAGGAKLKKDLVSVEGQSQAMPALQDVVEESITKLWR
jgi:hypothetical protein